MVQTVMTLNGSQIHVIRNSYTMGFMPLRGENSRSLACGLSPIQADKPWYFIEDLAYYKTVSANVSVL